MSFVVELSPTAEADLERLFDFLLDQADTNEDLDRAQAAIEAIRATAQHRLAITPAKRSEPRAPIAASGFDAAAPAAPSWRRVRAATVAASTAASAASRHAPARACQRGVEQLARQHAAALRRQQHQHLVELRALRLVHRHREGRLVRRQAQRRQRAEAAVGVGEVHRGAPSAPGSAMPMSPLNSSAAGRCAAPSPAGRRTRAWRVPRRQQRARLVGSSCRLTASTPRGPRAPRTARESARRRA